MKRVLLKLELTRNGAKLDVPIDALGALRFTGEGEIPLTTRLGELTVSADLRPRLKAFLEKAGDYREIEARVYDVTAGRNDLLYTGVGDRNGWTREVTLDAVIGDRRRVKGTVNMAFLSRLSAIDPTDLKDLETGDAYDTIPWADALALLAGAAEVKVGGAYGLPVINNFSTIRRVTRDLAGGDYDAGDPVGGVATLPDDGVAVGVDKYIMRYQGGAWRTLGKLWYKETAHAYDADGTKGGWRVLALGYRGNKIYGVAGIPSSGLCCTFTLDNEVGSKGYWPTITVTGADCYRWYFDNCAVRGRFQLWRCWYGSSGDITYYFHSIGWPALTSRKEDGVPKNLLRVARKLYKKLYRNQYYVHVINVIPYEFKIGDHLDIADEYAGRITKLFWWNTGHAAGATIFFSRRVTRAYEHTKYAIITKHKDYPTRNVMLPRPGPVIVKYVNPGEHGGEAKVPIKAIARRWADGNAGYYYMPKITDDVDGEILAPGYYAFVAENSMLDAAGARNAPETRNFNILLPPANPFPADIGDGIEYRQERKGEYSYSEVEMDQGRIKIYVHGTLAGEVDGAVVTAARNRWPGYEAFKYGKYLTITADGGDALPAGYTFRYDVSYLYLTSAGGPSAPYYSNGADIRILYKNDAGAWVELDRDILDYANKMYVAFKLVTALAAGASIVNRYAVLWRAKYPGTAKSNKANVYANYDGCGDLATWDIINGAAVIEDGAIKVTSTPAAFRAKLVTSTDEADLTVLVKIWRTGAKALKSGPVIRANSGQTSGAWAEANEATNHFRLIKIGGTTATGAQVYVNGAAYWVELKVTGSNKWWGRTWKNGDAIPAWALTRTIAVAGVEVGIRTESSAKDSYFDSVIVMYAVENEPVITASDTYYNNNALVFWEDMAWTANGNFRYPVFKSGYINRNGKLIRTWRNRTPSAPLTENEMYLAAKPVRHGGYCYGGVKLRTRTWRQLRGRVMRIDAPSGITSVQGAVALALEFDLTDEINRGDELIFNDNGPLYRVAEVSAVWRTLGYGAEVCPRGEGYEGPVTVVTCSNMAIPGEGIPSDVLIKLKEEFCNKSPRVAKEYYDRHAIFKYNENTGDFAVCYTVTYNTAVPKIDEVADFAADDIIGEPLEGEAAPGGWYIYKADEKYPNETLGVVKVYVNRRVMGNVNITGLSNFPNPQPGKAYIDFRGGDNSNELWVYLAERYADAAVIVAYEYYPEAPVTALWEYKGNVYFSTADGYLWRLVEGVTTTAVNVGRVAAEDYPAERTGQYFITAGGRLAQFAERHSGTVEGAWGGSDVDVFRRVAGLARASLTPIRETGQKLVMGYGPTVTVDVVVTREEAATAWEAIEVRYRGGRVVAGNPKALAELTAKLDCTREIYTPQHAMVIANQAWAELTRRRRDVFITGTTARPLDLTRAGYLTDNETTYKVAEINIDGNDVTARLRDLPVEVID